MAVCQGCQQEKPRVFKCGRCRSAQYCSKDCQRSAWRDHKQNCVGQVSSQTTVLNKTQMAILLGEGFSAKSIQIPQTPLIPLIRQHFNQHKSSSDKDSPTCCCQSLIGCLAGLCELCMIKAVPTTGNQTPLQPEMPAACKLALVQISAAR